MKRRGSGFYQVVGRGGGELTHFPIRKSGSGVDPHLDSRVE